MRWEDEKYVRIYTRDTVDWLGLSFIAQGLFCLILRKVDRAGILDLGKHGRRAVAIAVGFPGEWSRLEPALDELLADGCVHIDGDHLLVPNFIEAQEAVQSDAARKRSQRERARARVTGCDPGADKVSGSRDIPSRNGTPGHDTGQKVTSGHAESRPVTPSHSSLAEPSGPSEKPACLLARARGEPKSTPETAEPASPPSAEEAASGVTQCQAATAASDAAREPAATTEPSSRQEVPHALAGKPATHPSAAGASSPPASPAAVTPKRSRGPIVDEPPRPPLLVVDTFDLPVPAATVRGELEQRLGNVLDLADGFAEEVARLGEERALEVYAREAADYLAKHPGEAIRSLAFFVKVGKRYRPLASPPRPTPSLPGPTEEWLASLGDRRPRAEAQWQLAHDRILRAAWPERRAELLQREIDGLVARFPPEEPPLAAGGASC
jgi:hypothetical protein